MTLLPGGDGEPGIPGADPLLVVAVVLTAGVLLGSVARRFAKLPSITGQIVAGVLIGAYGLHLFDEEAIHGLAPITNFALGLVSVSVGSHLDLRRLRNARRRLGYLVAAESVLIPLFVCAATAFVPGVTWSTSLLYGTIAISTAPATVLAIVKETRSRGVFVKTLLGAVALNNIACIFLFEVARELAHVELTGVERPGAVLLTPARQVLGAVLIGGAAAAFVNLTWRLVARPDLIATSALLAILLTSGISVELGVSPLLACLFLGIAQANTTRSREKRVAVVFQTFQPAILAIFFTLAGMHLSFEQAGQAGMIALGLFSGRLLGKLTATHVAMRAAGATRRVRENLGLALVPQAGVAIGLVLLVQEDAAFADHRELVDLLIAVVLTVVTANEIVGPVLCRLALQRSGELGMDRSRLFDFLQEESLVVGMTSQTKEDAIRLLVDRLIASQDLAGVVDRETLLHSVLEREQQASTCLGGGLAVPHAILPEGREMTGVLGLSRAGLDFETPDGKPVHCMVLLATAESERERHVQVLATLARVVGLDPGFQERLYNAESAGHAYEVLHGEASVDFNTFLDQDEDGGTPGGRRLTDR